MGEEFGQEPFPGPRLPHGDIRGGRGGAGRPVREVRTVRPPTQVVGGRLEDVVIIAATRRRLAGQVQGHGLVTFGFDTHRTTILV